jgi:hypothetical protein
MQKAWRRPEVAAILCLVAAVILSAVGVGGLAPTAAVAQVLPCEDPPCDEEGGGGGGGWWRIEL